MAWTIRQSARRWGRNGIGAALCLGLFPLAIIGAAKAPARLEPLRVLVVGGGPDLQNNQVAIESNVRYVGKLLPRGTERITLFADGNPQNATVLYEEDIHLLPTGERLLRTLLSGREGGDDNSLHYRKPNLEAKLDGASKRTEIEKAFERLTTASKSKKKPIFLYFTGHGSPDESGFNNNVMDLWGEKEQLSVRDLARHIQTLPPEIPVTLIMVQCYAGSFANLLFENGDPKGNAIGRDFAGYFAAIKERTAAGCTPEINEEEYHDFTSYFFAALTGKDRVGRTVSGTDYNGDGRVGMDEAYCYTLANDKSIDVPVCTSDVFLRRYLTVRDSEIFRAKWSDVVTWATPAQRFALESLSRTLHAAGEDRLNLAYEEGIIRTTRGNSGGDVRAELRRTTDRYRARRNELRRTLFSRFPDLKNENGSTLAALKKEASQWLANQADQTEWKEFLALDDTIFQLEKRTESQEENAARQMRFVRLGKSVVLMHLLRTSTETALITRFEKLIEAEGRSLLPNSEVSKQTSL